jgi:hypothetical protein
MNPLPRETLAELVQTYGPALLDDARRVRALLSDTCPGDRREVGVLVAAVEEGIPGAISRASDTISVSGELDRLTTQLEDTRGLSYDAARWAVRSWAWVLGMADPPADQEGAATREPPSEASAPPGPPVPPAAPAPPTVPLPRGAEADAVTRRGPPGAGGPGGARRRRPRRPLVLAAIAAVLLVPAVLVPVAVATSRRASPPPATTVIGPTTASTTPPTTAATRPPTTAPPVTVPPSTASPATRRPPTTPSTTRQPITLGAPNQVAPEDGAVFDHFPRDTTLTWNAVDGADHYLVEVDFCQPAGCATSAAPFRRESVSSTTFRFRFVGAQPGRWRVRGVDAAGTEGPNSPWRGFRYTV